MEEKFNGIVLGGVNYGENDRILSILTLEKGVISAKIKGVKKAGAKLKFAQEPFCFAEFVFFTRGDKRNVKTASLIDSFYSIREDIEKFFAGGAVLEFAKKFTQENQSAPNAFALVLSTLKELAYGDKSPRTTLINFLLNALKIEGYQIKVGECLECGTKTPLRVFFDLSKGGFYCENCVMEGAREIKATTLQALRDASAFKEVDKIYATDALKFLEYYLYNETDESIKSLKELIKMG